MCTKHHELLDLFKESWCFCETFSWKTLQYYAFHSWGFQLGALSHTHIPRSWKVFNILINCWNFLCLMVLYSIYSFIVNTSCIITIVCLHSFFLFLSHSLKYKACSLWRISHYYAHLLLIDISPIVIPRGKIPNI